LVPVIKTSIMPHGKVERQTQERAGVSKRQKGRQTKKRKSKAG